MDCFGDPDDVDVEIIAQQERIRLDRLKRKEEEDERQRLLELDNIKKKQAAATQDIKLLQELNVTERIKVDKSKLSVSTTPGKTYGGRPAVGPHSQVPSNSMLAMYEELKKNILPRKSPLGTSPSSPLSAKSMYSPLTMAESRNPSHLGSEEFDDFVSVNEIKISTPHPESLDNMEVNKYNLAIYEIVQQQRQFLLNLEKLRQFYFDILPNILDQVDGDSIPLSKHEQNLLQHHLLDLISFSRNLNEALDKFIKDPSDQNSIGRIFVDRRKEFMIFREYIKNADYVQQLLKRLEKQSAYRKEFNIFSNNGRGQTVAEIALLPFQMGTRYKMMLEAVARHGSFNSEIANDLNDAIGVTTDIMACLNNLRKKQDETLDIFKFMRDIKGFPDELISGKRKLLGRYDVLQDVKSKTSKKKKLSHRLSVLLFQDVLVGCTVTLKSKDLNKKLREAASKNGQLIPKEEHQAKDVLYRYMYHIFLEDIVNWNSKDLLIPLGDDPFIPGYLLSLSIPREHFHQLEKDKSSISPAVALLKPMKAQASKISLAIFSSTSSKLSSLKNNFSKLNLAASSKKILGISSTSNQKCTPKEANPPLDSAIGYPSSSLSQLTDSMDGSSQLESGILSVSGSDPDSFNLQWAFLYQLDRDTCLHAIEAVSHQMTLFS